MTTPSRARPPGRSFLSEYGRPYPLAAYPRRLDRGGPPLAAYLALLRLGFAMPLPLPAARWALTPPFHPYLIPPLARQAIGGLLSVALSVTRALRTRAQALPGSLPSGARTFLDRQPQNQTGPVSRPSDRRCLTRRNIAYFHQTPDRAIDSARQAPDASEVVFCPVKYSPSTPRVSTILTPAERRNVDAAGQGLYRTLHRDSLDEVVRDIRERGAATILVSVSRVTPEDARRVARTVRDFPQVPTVALLTDLRTTSPQIVLSLGHSGIRTLVDARSPDGWRTLRQTLTADPTRDIAHSALARLAADLGLHPPLMTGCWSFFDALFNSAPTIRTVRALARATNLRPSVLASRFHYPHLPPPRRYLTLARITRAARLLENHGLTVANVANELDYSSPQSFSRQIHATLGVTPTAFRQTINGSAMLDRFRAELVLPYRPILRTLDLT
jgi:AraC-like DNA-binding protein